MKELRPVGVVGTGRYTPQRVLTNADLEKMVETSDEWIRTRTGIRERRIAAPEEAASDLALQAARRALEAADVPPEAVDLIIVATVTPDTLFPATSNLLQDRLGAKRAGAFDLLAGCTGMIYALEMAASQVAAGACDTVLVVGAEVLSRVTDWSDRSTCVLFGDGAGAFVVRPVEPGYGILGTILGSDGSGGEKLILPAGGSRRPASHETVEQGLHYLKMCGNEVFKFAVRVMGDAAFQVMERSGLAPDDIDFFVPHQANIRIIEAAARRLELPREKVVVNVDRYGNTSSASIPIAVDEAVRSGRVKKGDVGLLVGFGAGLTWGAVALRWAV